jgi:hypothetical protein
MDHATDRGRMARAEKRWRTRLALPNGLIERVQSAIRGRDCHSHHHSAARPDHVCVCSIWKLRLRRDLPSIKFFKETLEYKIGFKTEDGAILTHQTYAVGSCLARFTRLVRRWRAVARAIFWQATLAARSL